MPNYRQVVSSGAALRLREVATEVGKEQVDLGLSAVRYFRSNNRELYCSFEALRDVKGEGSRNNYLAAAAAPEIRDQILQLAPTGRQG